MKINHNEIFKYYQQGEYPPVDKLYAIGDIHGDLNAFILVLQKAKLISFSPIDQKIHWCGGTAHVVQIGDILDRKIRDTEFSDEDSELTIISLMCQLQLEAYTAGGGFHPIIGNHELMNILGIFDYVSPMGLKHFKNAKNRQEYFKVGGLFCQYLACSWNPIIRIGNFIFCHGGISQNIANKYTIQKINSIMRETLYGNESILRTDYFFELFLNKESILWNRDYSTDISKNKEITETKKLNEILKKYNAKYLIVGHTPQTNGIKVRFNNSVFCIDTGMSEAFGKKDKNKSERIHYIEILGTNQINVY